MMSQNRIIKDLLCFFLTFSLNKCLVGLDFNTGHIIRKIIGTKIGRRIL